MDKNLVEIKAYGSNQDFFLMHHRIELQEEVILRLFTKVQEQQQKMDQMSDQQNQIDELRKLIQK